MIILSTKIVQDIVEVSLGEVTQEYLDLIKQAWNTSRVIIGNWEQRKFLIQISGQDTIKVYTWFKEICND